MPDISLLLSKGIAGEFGFNQHPSALLYLGDPSRTYVSHDTLGLFESLRRRLVNDENET